MAIEEGLRRTGRPAAGAGAVDRARPSRARSRPRPRAVAIGLALVVALAGCGGDGDDEPTAAPTAPSGTTPPPAITPAAEADATPIASPSTPGATPAGVPTTVGDLAARIAAAWSGVTTYRANEVTSPAGGPVAPPVPAASPGASPAATASASPAAGPTGAESLVIDEVVLPDRKRRRIVAGGEVVSEIVVVAGQLYARGAVVRDHVEPTLSAETWVALEPGAVDAGTPVGQLLTGFLAPIGAPLSALPPETLALPARPAGQTTVDGRTCDRYEVVQTTATGERVDVAIGLDPTGLPCLVETRAGGQVTLATYVAFNEPIAIEAPAEFVSRAPGAAAAPAASPAASPVAGSTPAG